MWILNGQSENPFSRSAAMSIQSVFCSLWTIEAHALSTLREKLDYNDKFLRYNKDDHFHNHHHHADIQATLPSARKSPELDEATLAKVRNANIGIATPQTPLGPFLLLSFGDDDRFDDLGELLGEDLGVLPAGDVFEPAPPLGPS